MKTLKKTLVVFIVCFSILISAALPASAATKLQQDIDALCGGIKTCVVYDMSAGEKLYGKNEASRIYVASTTKLMTCLVALSVFGPDDVITVGNEIYLKKPNSSVSLIQPGHRLKVRTLLAALLLPSGNDAAYTVAVNAARKHSGDATMSNYTAVSYFCNLMNEKARQLGCTDTSFVNPEGWDDSAHYSTADDMTKIAIAAADNAVIASIANIHFNRFTFASGEWIEWENTNKLLDPESPYYYPYAHGLKTGTTPLAGNCLVAFAEKDGRKLLILAYGCATENDRFGRVRDIFELVYSVPVTGDLDNNGTITSADARLALRASVGLEENTGIIKMRGDTDGDGIITSADARNILRAAVGLDDMSGWKK